MESPSSAILASVLGAFAAQGLTLRMEERPKLGKKEVIQPHDIVCITIDDGVDVLPKEDVVPANNPPIAS